MRHVFADMTVHDWTDWKPVEHIGHRYVSSWNGPRPVRSRVRVLRIGVLPVASIREYQFESGLSQFILSHADCDRPYPRFDSFAEAQAALEERLATPYTKDTHNGS